jgi:hypothetical protein
MTQPRPSTFWRFVLGVLLLFSVLSFRDFFNVTERFSIVISTSRGWIALFTILGLFTVFLLASLVISISSRGERLVQGLESAVTNHGPRKGRGIVLFLTGLTGFAILTCIPYFIRVFGDQQAVRFLFFTLFCLAGTFGIRLLRQETPWITAFLVMALFQSLLQIFIVHMPQVTAYPFAMGWSETSRFYFPSLFLSKQVYGQGYPWPILHPTLHLLLAPPYAFDAPLWFHRLWQVALRFILVGMVVPPLLARLSIQDRIWRWLAGLAMFLFLFMGPLYFHLAIPVILVLWGFSLRDNRRTWAAVLLASIWCGWSRVNWYPVPGMLAAVLYLMEQPLEGRSLWRYLSRPFLWVIVGMLVAFISQRVYIQLSGIDEGGFFYTSLSSDLLWYRLLPNSTYSLGLLPAALLASLPVWIVLYLILRSQRSESWNSIRLLLILGALLVLFIGGILVSLKIGGGADLHNFDAYFVLLLIVSSYLIFARYRLESDELSPRVTLPWILVLAMFILPAWSWLRFNGGLKTYDSHVTQTTLQSLQEHIDEANAGQGEILFITQRHLISMHMLNGVRLVPEYEREDLMEMAMGNNTDYLDRFRRDMENQRFDLIIVDPLKFNILSRNRSFSEENNVWVRRVMRHILCNYRQAAMYPADDIALYVPQEGERQCPQQ